MDERNPVERLLEAAAACRSVAVWFAARNRVPDPQFVDMVMQDTSVRIVAGGGRSFELALGTPKAYVARIVHRACVDLFREFYARPGLADGYDNLGGDDRNPLAEAIAREELALARAALARMPSHMRATLEQWAMPKRRRSAGGAKTPTTSTRYVHVFLAKERFRQEFLIVRSARPNPPG